MDQIIITMYCGLKKIEIIYMTTEYYLSIYLET